MRRWWLLLGLFGWLGASAAQSPTALPQGNIAFQAAYTQILADQPHTYRLPIPDADFYTITIQAERATLLLFDAPQISVVEPVARQYRNGTLRLVYRLPLGDYRVWLSGQERYTFTVNRGDTLREALSELQPDSSISGRLENGIAQRYPLNVRPQRLITVQIAARRYAPTLQIEDGAGQRLSPLFENRHPTEAIVWRVYQLSATPPFALTLAGNGDYELSLINGDTLRTNIALDLLEQPYRSRRGGVYALPIATDARVLSLYSPQTDLTFLLHDARQQQLYARTTFNGHETLGKGQITVFDLTGAAPYSLTIIAPTAFEVSALTADYSQINSGEIALFRVQTVFVPAGRYPAFTLMTAGTPEIVFGIAFENPQQWQNTDLRLLDRQGAALPLAISADGTLIIVRGQLNDQPPYTLSLPLSGQFALSAALLNLPLDGIAVQLTTDEVNLRAEANTTSPILTQGKLGQALQAFGRSEDGLWLLANRNGIIVWVYRPLVEVLDRANLDTLPIITSNGALIAVTPTPTLTATITPSATISETPRSSLTSSTASAITTTPLPGIGGNLTPIAPTSTPTPPATFGAVVCTITSGGGVNLRSSASTQASVVGFLASDAQVGVIGQAQDANGMIWWQLEDQAWVRSDVVLESGDCTMAPTRP
jgi:hypothetical protein